MNNLLEITKTTGDCAQYTGVVTIASYLGDRLLQKETHYNKGLPTLFTFISNCLQGRFSEAKASRPCKLVMLKKGTGECLTDTEVELAGGNAVLSVPTESTALDSNGEHYWSSKYAICSPMLHDTAAIATNSIESSSVTYHFRIPFLSLVSGAQIKKLMLLPPIASNYTTDACAYFVLDNPIEVPVAGGNFTIIIDWTLTFTNSSHS